MDTGAQSNLRPVMNERCDDLLTNVVRRQRVPAVVDPSSRGAVPVRIPTPPRRENDTPRITVTD